jgi:hypothetical protein
VHLENKNIFFQLKNGLAYASDIIVNSEVVGLGLGANPSTSEFTTTTLPL